MKMYDVNQIMASVVFEYPVLTVSAPLLLPVLSTKLKKLKNKHNNSWQLEWQDYGLCRK